MKKAIYAIFVLLLFLVACAQQQEQQQVQEQKPAQTQGSYKIGVMLPLSGDGAAYGLPIQKSLKIALDEVNAKGGVNGRKLEAIYEDSKCNGKDGNSAAQKLINVDKVKVIVGGACSGETMGAAPLAEQNKIVLISPSATSPDITKAGDFIFRLAPSDAYAGVVAANFAFTDLGAKKAAIVSESTDYSQGLRRVFKEKFTELGGQVVVDETYNPEDTDFRTQVTKVKAANPDVFYVVPQTKAKGLLAIKQAKEAGIKAQLLTAEILIGRDIVAENSAEVDGLIGVEQKYDDKAPKSAALLAKYKEQANEDAPFPAFQSAAYDIVYLLADAISKNGYDGEKIRDYLYAVENYEGAVGKVTLDENGEPILDFNVKQIKNGQLVTLK